MAGYSAFGIFELIIGGYLIYAAISGKGKLYENDYLKKECSREQYVKVLRILGGITGALILIRNGLETAGIAPAGSAANWILWGVGFVFIAAMVIYSARVTDRQAARKGAATVKKPGQSSDPHRAAFVFDEDEDTAK